MTMQDNWTETDAYFAKTLLPADDVLDTVAQRCAREGLPSINVAPVQGKLLHLLARMCGARRILEIGTLGGYSAIWLARALPEDGKMITLELSPEFAALARENIRHAGLSGKVDVMEGAALHTLDALISNRAAAFDFVFIDADKENNPHYLDRVLKLSRPGTVILCDNVVRSGGVTDPDNSDPSVVGVRRFMEQISRVPGISSTAVQTVGLKGWDGFSLSIV